MSGPAEENTDYCKYQSRFNITYQKRKFQKFWLLKVSSSTASVALSPIFSHPAILSASCHRLTTGSAVSVLRSISFILWAITSLRTPMYYLIFWKKKFWPSYKIGFTQNSNDVSANSTYGTGVVFERYKRSNKMQTIILQSKSLRRSEHGRNSNHFIIMYTHAYIRGLKVIVFMPMVRYSKIW